MSNIYIYTCIRVYITYIHYIIMYICRICTMSIYYTYTKQAYIYIYRPYNNIYIDTCVLKRKCILLVGYILKPCETTLTPAAHYFSSLVAFFLCLVLLLLDRLSKRASIFGQRHIKACSMLRSGLASFLALSYYESVFLNVFLCPLH